MKKTALPWGWVVLGAHAAWGVLLALPGYDYWKLSWSWFPQLAPVLIPAFGPGERWLQLVVFVGAVVIAWRLGAGSLAALGQARTPGSRRSWLLLAGLTGVLYLALLAYLASRARNPQGMPGWGGWPAFLLYPVEAALAARLRALARRQSNL